jgi:hypothetical protein
MFTSKCKLYIACGNSRPKHKPAINPEDMQKLGTYFKDFQRNPNVLLQAVWFHLCYFFGRRGREGWCQMNKTTFIICEETDGKYVQMNSTEKTKNHQGGHRQTDMDYSDQKMYGIGADIFSFYLSKLNPKCDRLFQHPLVNFEQTGITWYKNSPVGKNVLSEMMKIISKQAGLSKVYTCHSVRASTITNLHRAGVERNDIKHITNHKNSSSLDHYIDGLSKDQCRNFNNLLESSLYGQQTSNSVEAPKAEKTLPQTAINKVHKQPLKFDTNFNFTALLKKFFN